MAKRKTGLELHVIYSAEIERKGYEGNGVMAVDPNSGNFMVIEIEGVRTPHIIEGLKSLLILKALYTYALWVYVDGTKIRKQSAPLTRGRGMCESVQYIL